MRGHIIDVQADGIRPAELLSTDFLRAMKGGRIRLILGLNSTSVN